MHKPNLGQVFATIPKIKLFSFIPEIGLRSHSCVFFLKPVLAVLAYFASRYYY